MSLPLLLWVSEAATGTGFSRVAHSLLRYLKEDFEVHHFGLNTHAPLEPGEWNTVLRASGSTPPELAASELVERIRPDCLIVCCGLLLMPRFERLFQQVPVGTRIIVYGPVDGTKINPQITRALSKVDLVVAYTTTAKQALQDSAEAIRRKEESFAFPSIEVIPHGVDRGTFFPYPNGVGETWPPDRKDVRRELLGPNFDSQGTFIVLNANRNQARKRIDLTLSGFAEFAAGKPPNVFLYLHMGWRDVGWNLTAAIEEAGLQSRILPRDRRSKQHPHVPDSQLNKIYSACDVGVNTSTGEGWGLISFEHAATGACQIAPAHTAPHELWKDSALLLPCSRPLPVLDPYQDEQVISTPHLAHLLERLYSDRRLLAEMSKLAFENSRRERYSWSSVAQEWRRLLMELVG